MYRIPLRVKGVDLEDGQTLVRIAETLDDLAWSKLAGVVIAAVYAECGDPVGAAIQVARRITHYLPEATVEEVYPDLVSTSDIAQRVGMSRETVRLWVAGKRGPGGFPLADGMVSATGASGAIKVWRWAAVHQWLQGHYQLGDTEDVLAPEQVAEVNAALLQVPSHPIDDEWEVASSSERRLVNSRGDYLPILYLSQSSAPVLNLVRELLVHSRSRLGFWSNNAVIRVEVERAYRDAVAAQRARDTEDAP